MLAAVLFAATLNGAAEAHVLLSHAMAAMGGRAALAAVRGVDFTAVGTRAMVEQSVDPAGPYFVDWRRIRVRRDDATGRTRIDSEDAAYAGNQWWLEQREPLKTSMIVEGDSAVIVNPSGAQAPGSGFAVAAAQEDLAFAPERILFTVDAANDARVLPDAIRDGISLRRIAFTWKSSPCVLSLDARTFLPWSIAWTRAYPRQIFLNAWGDVHSERTFTMWSLEPGGLRYPREWTTYRLGLPDDQMSIVALRFTVTPDEAALNIDPAAIRPPSTIAAIPFLSSEQVVRQIAPGVDVVPGAWNVAFVRQDDGVVVIEAPIGPEYAKAVFAYARLHYRLRVKAVVTTSDSWPHIAGVRQAVAERIPIYVLDLNVPILRRLIAAPHTFYPDDLTRVPVAPNLRVVRTDTVVGHGSRAIIIAPYRTATGERQMMVYVPALRALYTSDLFAPDGNGGWFTPEYVDEARGAIRREGWSPITIWGMHYTPRAFDDLIHPNRGT